MKREVITSGKNIDDAIDEAALQLGVDRDDLSFEIIDTPSKGFLGFGGSMAKITAWVGEDDPQKAPAGELEIQARAFFDKLFDAMDLTGINTDIVLSEKNMKISLTGENLGVLIGKRGETMYALQYLASLALNKQEGQYVRVELDIEGYRAKRTDALEKLAVRMADRVTKTKRNVTLEYMQAYERRIIHSTLQNHQYVTTRSVGEEPFRKIIITYSPKDERTESK